MRQIEDLLSALSSLEGDAAPDADTVLGAVLATPGRVRPRGRRHQLRAVTGTRLAAAVTAAAAIAAVALTATLIGHGTSPRSDRAGPAPADSSRPPVATPASFDGLPGYFLETAAYGIQPAGTVSVVSTATGKAIAEATLPGVVDDLTASQNGTGFAAVDTGASTTFYEIRLTASSSAATVTRLPIPPVTAPVDVIASSPNGSELAISTYLHYPVRGGALNLPQNLIVASTATGKEHQWSAPDPTAADAMGTLSWLADGRTLAFGWQGNGQENYSLRLLDTTVPGSDLLSGRTVMPGVTAAGELSEWMAPGGTTVVAVTDFPKQIGTLGGHTLTFGSVLQISASTGRARLLYYAPPTSSGCGQPLWINSSGSRLLGTCLSGGGQGKAYVGLISQGHVTRLPWLNWVLSDRVAFG
jgi:hypothetical protein